MDNEKFESIIQQSIAEEYEAAANYTKRAAKCEEKGMEDAAKLFRDIAQEEMVHVGEFQALMEKYNMTNLDAIKQGEEEAKEILGAEVPAENLEESVNEETYIHKVTKAEWDRTHDDYKMIKNGKKYMMYIDPFEHKTVLGPVEIVDEEPANEDVPNKNVYVDAHIQGRAKILSDGGYSHEVNGKYCYDIELEDGRKMQAFKSEIKSETEKSANEEFLDKGEIFSRVIRLLDLTTNEDVKAVNLLSDVVNFMDVDQLQKFYEFIQEELDMNYDEIFGSKESDESVNEAGGIVVHTFKLEIGNSQYLAHSMKDAIAYVKEQDLDLENGDYFDIHAGDNSSEISGLKFWGGIGRGYWRNVLDNPRTRENDKEAIRSREIKDIKDLHESVNEDINASSSVYIRAVDEELDSEVIELAKKCKSIYEFEKADPELSQECELFTTINGNEFSGSDLEDLCDNINYSYSNAYIEPNLDEWVIEEEQNCIRVGYILVEAGSEDFDESADPDTALFYSVEACYIDRDPQNYNSYERMGQFTTLEEARKYAREKIHELDTIQYSGLCIASSEYEYNDENPDELTDTYKILEFYPVAGEVQVFNEKEEISELAFLNSGDIIKTKDGKEAVIEGLLYDSNNIHIGYEITYLDQEESSYEYNDVLFDDIAEIVSRASNENGTMASMGAAPTVVAGKGIVTAEPTKICEELKALKEALKG